MITDLEFEKSDILKSFLILDLTSGQSVLENLDFLVKESELIISSNELGTKDISLVDDVLVIFLELLDFFIGELDDCCQFLDFGVLFNSDDFSTLELLLPNLGFSQDLISIFHVFSHVGVFNRQSLIFGFNLILELRNLMGCDLELSLKLSDLILCLNQVLRVKISIRSNSFIQVLLLLKLSFELDVLLLELTDQVLLQFDLFNHLHEICIGFGGFMRESVSFLLKRVDLYQQVLDVLLFSSSLSLQKLDFSVLLGNFILVSVVLIFGLLDRLGHHVSESDQVNDLLLVHVCVSSEMLDLSGQGVDTVLGEILLVFSFFLLSGDSVLVIEETVVGSSKFLVALLELSDLASHLTDVDIELESFLVKVTVFSLQLLVVVLKFLVGFIFHAQLLGLFLEAVGILIVFAAQLDELLFLLRLSLIEISDLLVFDLNTLLQVLLLRLKQLGIPLKLDLLLAELINQMLLLLDLLLLFDNFVLELQNLLIQCVLRQLKVINLLLLLSNLLIQLLLLLDESVHCVVLAEGESRSLFDDFVEFSDFFFESRDDSTRLFFFVLGGFDQFPALFDFSSQNCNGVGVLLCQLDSTFNSCSVLENCIIQFLASFNESFFRFI